MLLRPRRCCLLKHSWTRMRRYCPVSQWQHQQTHQCQPFTVDSHDPSTKRITIEHRNCRRLLSWLLIVTLCSVHWLQTAKSAQRQQNKYFTAPPPIATQINHCSTWYSTIEISHCSLLEPVRRYSPVIASLWLG
jgi:hypothetical protein